jgi:N,N'-diacetylchitobiose transport system permease protein
MAAASLGFRPRRPLGRKLTPYVLLAPGLVVIAGLLLYPLYQMAVMSFQKIGIRQIRGASPPEFVGFGNYQSVLENELFWQSLRNTVVFAAITVAATLVLGTLVGLLLNQLGRKMSMFVIVGIMLAWATPQIAVAVIWRWMFDDQRGVANWVLNALPDGLSSALLGRSDWSGFVWTLDTLPLYTVLVLAVVWQSFPFIAVSVLAGLKSVPGELYEAVRIDGAGAWRAFWQLTFPLLRPVFAVLFVLSVIWDFKVFTQLYVLAGSTLANRDVFNLSLYGYAEAFKVPQKMGMGSAIAIILTVILLIVTAVYVRQIVRQEELD